MECIQYSVIFWQRFSTCCLLLFSTSIITALQAKLIQFYNKIYLQMHLEKPNRASLYYYEQNEQKVEQHSLCTSSILFPEKMLSNCEVMRMKHQIAELSIIALRLGRQKIDYEHTKEQLKTTQQQVCSLAIENRQLRSRNTQLFEQLETRKLQIESVNTKNKVISSQIANLNQQLQILKKKLTQNLQDLPFKLQTLSKICIKMGKQKLQQQQILQHQNNQKLRQFEVKENNWKNELLLLQTSKKQVEKMLKNKFAISEHNYKDLEMKHRLKCKELQMVNNQLIECKSKYLQAIEEMNRKIQLSMMRAKEP